MSPGLPTPLRRRGGTLAGFDRRLVAPMILGAVLNPVNSSIIAVSLVPIGIAFGAPPSRTAWLVSALYLATSIGQPVVGRLVDTYGPRRLFLAGTALAGVAGVLGTVAPSLGVLIAARVLLGFGTCAGYPAAMYLIRSESRRTGHDSPAGVLTLLAVSAQTIAVIGPTLGGLLIGLGGWRTTFAVNVPLSVACLVLGARRLPRTPAPDGRRRPGLDLAGICLFAAMLTSLLLFLMHPRVADWYLLLVTAAAAAGFAVRELRVAEPFIDLRVLGGNAPLLTTYARNLLAAVVSYAFLYGFTQWLEDGRGLSPTGAGLILLPMFLTAIAVSGVTGRRPEIRGKLLVGSATQLAVCAMLLLLGAGSPIWLLVALAVILGLPQGLNSLANQNALYHQADPARMGSSAGLLRTSTYLGAIIAAAANGAFFGHRADTRGLHHLALFVIVVAALFLTVTLLDRSLRRTGDPSTGSADPSPAPEATVTDTPTAIDPRRAALLVMDYQPGILHALPDADALLDRVAGAIATVRRHGGHVGYVRVAFDDADYASVPATNRMATRVAAAGRALHSDSPATAVHDRVAPEPGDIVVRKTRVGAFSTTDLAGQLGGRGVDTLVLAGISTSGVVLSTVRDAADRDYRVLVLADGCADTDPETHDFLTTKVFPRQADVITIADLDTLLATADA